MPGVISRLGEASVKKACDGDAGEDGLGSPVCKVASSASTVWIMLSATGIERLTAFHMFACEMTP